MTTEHIARWIALPGAVVAISTSSVLIRLTTAPPLQTATARMVIASLVLLGAAVLIQRHDFRRIDLRAFLILLGTGALLGVHFAFWTQSLFLTSVASAVLLVDTHPVMVALGAFVFLKEQTSRGTWAGIALTLAGSLVIAMADLRLGGSALLGDALAFGAAVSFAAYLVIGRHMRQSLGLAVYTGVIYAFAAMTLAVMALSSGLNLLAFSEHDALVWVGLVIFPTLGGHTVFAWALRHVPASVVGVSLLGEPLVASSLAWLLLGEAPAPTSFIGGAIILSGLYLALRSDSPAETRGAQ